MAKRGRPMGGKAFRQEEDDVIRLGLANGRPVPQIAALLGRGRSSVYKRIERMRITGNLGQGVFDLAQVQAGADHDQTAV